MKARIFATAVLLTGIITGCQQQSTGESAPQAQGAAADVTSSQDTQQLKSGINLDAMDNTITAGEDFFAYANGRWLEETDIPADKSNYSSFTKLADEAEASIKAIVEQISSADNIENGSPEQKIRDFYQAFMNEQSANTRGFQPLIEDLAALDEIDNSSALLSAMGNLLPMGVNQPVVAFVNQDSKQATQYALYLTQAGLSLPDRDYYLQEGERYEHARELLKNHVITLFELIGVDQADSLADDILALETVIAQHHWNRVDNRNRDKTYNKLDYAELRELSPGVDWNAFFASAEIPEQAFLIARQPSYLQALPEILDSASLDTWKNYLKFQLLDAYAAYLSEPFAQADFEFHRQGLQGITEQRPRWKRAIEGTNQIMGEQLGQIYVQRHFQPEAKQRMTELVENLREAYRQSILGLDWMGEETKQQALDKLAKFSPKIGYPDDWRDYSALSIAADDLVGNIKRGSHFDFRRNINKLGGPIDRGEWFMTPQTVNAYYNPPMNEIVFPAAILQPPFFYLDADNAVNYGGIGAVIGHEMGHGFDDQGSKSDGDGNLRNWWTDQDREEFQIRTAQLVEQYAAYDAIDGEHVNGELTLGENIGDLGGLSIAYKAWQNSLDGKPSPVIDGLTGQQRFFLGWAQVWQRLYRDEELKRRLKVDPHSPAKYRVNGVVTNMPTFYEAFEVNPEDSMYTAPENRVKIW